LTCFTHSFLPTWGCADQFWENECFYRWWTQYLVDNPASGKENYTHQTKDKDTQMEGGIVFYLCPSKIFFVAFFSATIDGRNLIFDHKLHIGTPYCGKRFWAHQIPTSCLPILHIPMLADRGSSLNGGLLGYNTKGLIVGSVFGECHTLQKTKFYAPTQLAILFQWQSKVFDLLHPFLPSFL
jgi:hypothetical protein